MSRLTKKNNQGTGSWTQFGDEYIPAHNIKHKQCVNKLGKLEDLEDELGCPLDVVFKAIKNGIDGYKELILEYDENEGWYFNAIWKYNDFGDYGDILYLKYYKKTWWLRSDKEE